MGMVICLQTVMADHHTTISRNKKKIQDSHSQ
jgi:hypothetical protein